MSFVKIQGLLHAAFQRIDRLHVTQTTPIDEYIQGFLGERDTQYIKGIIVVYTASSVKKQSLLFKKEKILTHLKSKFPVLVFTDIRFQGPRQKTE
ncbi:MAG: hypothetical protein AAB372_01660 [Patescibacteria group bacterium]